MWRSIAVILLITLISLSIPGFQPVYTITVQGEELDKGGGYYIISIDPSRIPGLIGARADSLTAEIYNGSRWISLELYIWNGSKTVFFSGSRLAMPRYGRVITRNTRIIVKIPGNIENVYTDKWSIDTALKHLHHRSIIYYKDPSGRINSFYLYYDYRFTGLRQNTITPQLYDRFTRMSNRVEITDTVHQYSRSFIVDPVSYRIIDQNLTYREFLAKLDRYRELVGEPPWYIDGGGSGGGGSQPSQPPREEEFFHLHITNNTIINSTNNVESYSIYFGACIYDTKLAMYLENLEADNVSILDVEIVKTLEGLSSPLDSETVTITLQPGEIKYYEVSLSDLGLVSYNCDSFYRYNITFKRLSGSIEVIAAYFGLVKDLTGVDNDGPTPELKYAKYGWEISNDTLGGFTKDENTQLDTDEVTLYMTPVINGFYNPVGDELDDEAGLYIALEYTTDDDETFTILVNNVEVYSTTLEPGENSVFTAWIPISMFKDIVSTATYNGEGLTISIKSSILQKQGTYLKIHEASLKLPIHPELWKPHTQSFTYTYLMSTSSLYAYRINGIELTGVASVAFSSIDYTKISSRILNDRTSIIDLIASGTNYYDENVPDYYISGIEITMLFSKDFFDSSTIPKRPSENVFIDNRPLRGEGVKDRLDLVKTAFYIADIIDLISEFGNAVSPETVNARGEISTDNFLIGFGLFLAKAWYELIKSTESELVYDNIENETHKGITGIWYSNGILAKYFRARLTVSPKLVSDNVEHDGKVVIIIKLITESRNGLMGSGALTITIPIKHGYVPTGIIVEPETLAGQVPYK